MMDLEESLTTKRKDLNRLIDHIMHMEPTKPSSNSTHTDPDSTVLNCVLSRLMAELRRSEVELMRRHILSCPNLSPNSPALETAIPALFDAMEIIAEKERKMNMSLLTPPALAAEILGLEEGSVSGQSSSSPNSSFASDLDTMDVNVGNGNGNGNVDGVNNGLVDHIPNHVSSSMYKETTTYTTDTNDTTTSPVSTTPIITSKSKTTRKSSSFLSYLGTILRSLLLDLPFATTITFLFTIFFLTHIHTTFIDPILNNIQWTKAKMDTEYTNYRRVCDASDISTTNVDDLIIDEETMTAEEAAHVTYKHGMSIFPNVVDDEALEEMREWVLHRNANLNEDDEIPLISQNRRWSFPIGADEDPSVPPVLRQIATHAMLQNTMDLVMGEDPALVELTAITAAYGADHQGWHADNEFQGSQMHYARSFVPMYSIFIPLQDTTYEMGATSGCPGSHLCGSEENLGDVCDALDFRVHDTRGRLAKSEKDHVWKKGDAFLFNLNLYHRGPKHSDPKGEERVMLIMTISNRPTGPHFDNRQISLGTSYSNKWDMWGMTMKDLAIVETMMGFPWKYLRALGIWKPKGNRKSHDDKWGWDYITVACSRIMNDQMGFRYEDLELLINKTGKYGPLFQYLFGYVPEEGGYDETTMTLDNGWREYLLESSKRFIYVAAAIYGASCVFFLFFSLVATGFVSTGKRFFKINAFIGLIFYGLNYHVSNIPWGRDIISGRAFESPFLDRVKSTGTLVMPTKHDVLFSGRLNSPFLSGFNDVFDHQLGNAKLNALISQYAGAFSKTYSSPSNVQRNILQQIINNVSENGAQILQNDANGDWLLSSEEQAATLVRRSLVAESNPIVKGIHQELKFLKSECIHGFFRKSTTMKSYCLINLEHLSQSLVDIKIDEKTMPASFTWKHRLFVPTMNKRSVKKETPSAKKKKLTLKAGDMVEYDFENDGWFAGKVVSLNKRMRTMAIRFNDGDYSTNLKLTKARPFKPYKVGEHVISHGMDCTFMGVKAIGDAMIRLDDSGVMHNVDINQISRPYD